MVVVVVCLFVCLFVVVVGSGVGFQSGVIWRDGDVREGGQGSERASP